MDSYRSRLLQYPRGSQKVSHKPVSIHTTQGWSPRGVTGFCNILKEQSLPPPLLPFYEAFSEAFRALLPPEQPLSPFWGIPPQKYAQRKFREGVSVTDASKSLEVSFLGMTLQ